MFRFFCLCRLWRIAASVFVFILPACDWNSDDDNPPPVDAAVAIDIARRPPDQLRFADLLGPDLVLSPDTTIAQARSNGADTPITVVAVVTAVRGSDPVSTVEWYIEDEDGGPLSGVDVFCNRTTKVNPCPANLAPPALYDYVLVRGTLVTSQGKLTLNPSASLTLSPFHDLPPIDQVDVSLLAPDAVSPYRGVLVEVLSDTLYVDDATPLALLNPHCARPDGGAAKPDAGMALCSGCNPATWTGFHLTDGEGGNLLVQNSFPLTEHLASSPECQQLPGAVKVVNGTTFSLLNGILDFDPNSMSQVLMPTRDGDYRTP